jgi:hypothetical protein
VDNEEKGGTMNKESVLIIVTSFLVAALWLSVHATSAASPWLIYRDGLSSTGWGHYKGAQLPVLARSYTSECLVSSSPATSLNNQFLLSLETTKGIRYCFRRIAETPFPIRKDSIAAVTPTPTPTPMPTTTIAVLPYVTPAAISLNNEHPSDVVQYCCCWYNTGSCNWWLAAEPPSWLRVLPTSGSGYDGEIYDVTVSLNDASSLPPALHEVTLVFHCDKCCYWSDVDLMVTYDSRSAAEVMLNGSSFSSGAPFLAVFKLNRSVERQFTAYAVFILPNGAMRDAMTLSSEIKPLATNVSALPAGFSYALLSTVIPSGAPNGEYELVVAFFDPTQPITGRGDSFLDVSSKFTIE